MHERLESIAAHGQSIWLDDLTRDLVRDGTLHALVDAGVSGITSNPTIFRRAIVETDAYDASIEAFEDEPGPERVMEELALADVIAACDVLRPIFEASGRTDGFVSYEVSPHLARDGGATFREAKRLARRIDRPNVFIKIPGTRSGVEAVRRCLEDGINVNVTLLFSVERYRAVAEAYERAVETSDGRTGACVASFFLSRIDAKVDAHIDETVRSSPAVADLRGQTALALARSAYAHWRGVFGTSYASPHPESPMHKLLWASTSVKDPTFPPMKYVDALVLPHTIDTVPRKTLDQLRDPGVERARIPPVALEDDLKTLDRIQNEVIDLDRVAVELEEEGLRKFVEPYDELLKAIDERRRVHDGS